MKKKTWMLIVGALAGLLLIGAMGAVAVYAQSPTPPTPPNGQAGPGEPGGPGHGDRQLSQAELDAAAKALGMSADDLSAQLKDGKTLEAVATAQGVDFKTVMDAMQAVRPVRLGTAEMDAAAKALGMTSDELSTQLQNGKTLADLAAEKGVALQGVQDAIKAARQAEMKTQIEQAVTSGKMTQDKADWLLEGLNKGYLDGPDGFGFGHGFGMMGGPGRGPGGGQPPSQAAPTSAP